MFARSHPDPRLPDRYQLLRDHLANVSRRARLFLSVLGPMFGLLAELCAAVHDLGKSTQQWQRWLLTGTNQVDHSHVGTVALEQNRELWLKLPYVITQILLPSVVAGHHGGLRNLNASEEGERPPTIEVMQRGREDIQDADMNTVVWPFRVEDLDRFTLPMLTTDPDPRKQNDEQRLAIDTFTRFLFSSLVWADAADAAEFEYGGAREWIDKRFPSMTELARLYEKNLADRVSEANPRLKVSRLQRRVSEASLLAAKQLPGFFSLTAPTGLGKTWAVMRFALHHSRQHGLRRIIYTAPFTSIIEQNVDEYRKLIDRDAIVEHHSNIKAENDSKLNRQLSRFWSAPIVCTSNLQLVESLFSNRVGRCQKLHNIMRSCIIFDEAQELPAKLLGPTIDMLKRLVYHYGCTVVFTTATQPALQQRFLENGLEAVTEIVPDQAKLMQEARRVEFRWPESSDDRWTISQLSDRLKRHPRVICTVYTRNDAVEVFRRLPVRGRYHLSALMCAQHRTDVLDEVRERLALNKIVRLVCTRLIKAGVNVDFPKGYEAAQAPDDAAQFGGRINRFGKRRRYRSIVRVFYLRDSKPVSGEPRQAHDELRTMLERQYRKTGRYELDLFDPKTYEQYFSAIYQNDIDYYDVQQDRINLNFETVGRKFRFIRDNYMTTVLVPYRDGANIIEQLREKGASDPELLRRMQRYTVSIYQQDRTAMEGMLQEVHPDLDELYCLDPDAAVFYRDDIGLCSPDRLRLMLEPYDTSETD